MSGSRRAHLGLAAIALAFCALACRKTAPAADPSPTTTPRRIVSMAPNVTEILFALGVGDRVVGDTDYCFYPPEARTRPHVGGFDDPNLEVLESLRPDLVVVYREHEKVRDFCARAGIEVLPLRLLGLDDVYQSIRTVGARVDRRERAEELVAKIEADLAAVRRRVAGTPPRSVLLVLGAAGPGLSNLIVAGRASYLGQIVTYAGGTNVFDDVADAYLRPSKEEIVRRAPEVVLELEGEKVMGSPSADPMAAWSALGSLPAVKEKRVRRLQGSHVLTPGPRIAQTVAEMAAAIHPELGEERP